jgi:tetratricopeptide (TPR) repeat protein
MPFCRECGGQVEATWKFCSHCNSEQESNVVIGNDSVHVGDITVNQVDEESVKKTLKQIFEEHMAELAKIGFTKDSSPTELTPSQEAEVRQVLEISEKLTEHGIEIDPWSEIALGNAAKHAKSFYSSREYYISALQKFQSQEIWTGQIAAYIGLTQLLVVNRSLQDLRELEELYHWIVRISEKYGDKSTQSSHLFKLGLLAEYENDLEKAKQYYEKVLFIDKQLGNHLETTLSLSRLGKIAEWRGESNSAERLFSEVLSIITEYGEKADQVYPLRNLAFIYFTRGQLDKAGQLFGNAQEIINSEKENESNWFFTDDIS